MSGTVNLDGKALPEGDISFVGETGTIPVILPVKDGAFEGMVKPGKKRVEVRAYRPGKAPSSTTEPAGEYKENYIPERYNTDSTLTAEVAPAGGVNPSTFDVKSK